MRRHLRRLSRALRLAVWLAAAWLEVGLAQWRGRRVSPARRQRAYRRLARILALRISLWWPEELLSCFCLILLHFFYL